MKLREEKRQIQSNLVGDQSFKIKADAKAFRILSDKLYSNKIRAVIRELSTNAYDSHVDSEQPDRPFIVQLPNHLEPTFAVEDFGTGMTEEKVLTLYSTYFDSDKIESNTVVGALGLGSKSPFAYTDTFTVVSKHKGTKSVYTCFLNEEEVPSILKINDEPTREENGLRVEFAVQEKDFHRFENEASMVLRPFKVKPVIQGTEIEIDTYPKPILEGKGWKLLSSRIKNVDYRYDTIAIQGNIEYPIDIYSIKQDSDKLSKKYKIEEKEVERIINLFNSSVFIIEFNLGALGFAPSREHLEYNKFTNDAIFTKFWEIAQSLESEITKELNNIDSTLDLTIKYKKLDNSLRGYISDSFDSDLRSIKLNNGLTLYETISLTQFEYGKDFEVYDYESYSGFYSSDVKCVKIKRRVGFKKDNEFHAFVSSDNNRDNTKVIFHDQQNDKEIRSGIYRLKQHIRRDKFKAIVIYNKKMLDTMNEKNYELISTYPYLKKPGRKGSSNSPSNDTDIVHVIKATIVSRGNNIELSWEGENVQVKDLIQDPDFKNDSDKAFATDFYNRLKCTDIDGREIEIEVFEIRNKIEYLFKLKKYAGCSLKLGDEFFRFYTMKKHFIQKKELKEYTWNSVQDVLKEKFDKVFTNKDVQEQVNKIMKINNYESIPNDVKKMAYIVNNTKLRDYEKRLYGLTSKIEVEKDNNSKKPIFGLGRYQVMDILSTFRIDLFDNEKEKNFNEKLYKLIKKVYNNIISKRYSMMSIVDPSNFYWVDDFIKNHREKINSYVELVNNNLS